MISNDTVNVLLVDDQPAKLLAYEVILQELGENLIKTASAREAFECLLKNDVAVVLVDVCMPELDGFQLAAMISRASALPKNGYYLYFRHPSDRCRPPARV